MRGEWYSKEITQKIQYIYMSTLHVINTRTKNYDVTVSELRNVSEKIHNAHTLLLIQMELLMK